MTRRVRRRLLDLGMRVTVYNPLAASSYWRIAAVLAELRHDAAIGLPGSQRRVVGDAPPYQSHKSNGGWGLSWGFRRGAHESNSGAGVSLLFSTRWFRQGHLRQVCSPPLSPSGRCGAAVVINGLGHFCFVVLYLLPKPSGRGEATPWIKTLDAVFKWTDGLLMSLPTRCLLVLMLDLDDRLGRPRTEESSYLIGDVGAGNEGDSATRFRALLRRHSMAVPSTFHLATPIFHGSSGRSRIDFVATHSSVQFSRIFVKFSAGRRLQLPQVRLVTRLHWTW